MKNKYIDLIDQTFEFPQDEFHVEDGELHFHDINMMDIINQYGTPLKITYLPKISSQIQRAKRLFNVAMAKVDYKGTYNYLSFAFQMHYPLLLVHKSFGILQGAFGIEPNLCTVCIVCAVWFFSAVAGVVFVTQVAFEHTGLDSAKIFWAMVIMLALVGIIDAIVYRVGLPLYFPEESRDSINMLFRVLGGSGYSSYGSSYYDW